MVVDSALSERAQEPKQLVIGLESFCFLTCGRHFFESLLLHSQIRFDIAVSCLNALVAEPQSYDRNVNSCLKKMHCTCVSNEMRSDALVGKAWAGCGTSLNSLLKDVGDAISAQCRATGIGESCRCAIPCI